MAKYSLMVFRKDCMGCHACEVACKQEHGLGVGPRFVRVLENGPDFFPIYCHHCANAPCQRACPVDAISRNADGIVLIDRELCIGCRECLPACPFGAMQFDDDSEFGREMRSVHRPVERRHGPGLQLGLRHAVHRLGQHAEAQRARRQRGGPGQV